MVVGMTIRKAYGQGDGDWYRQRHILHDDLSNLGKRKNGKRGKLYDRPLVAAAVYVAGFVEQLAGGRLVDAGLWSKTNDQLWCDQLQDRIKP
jgi:hypothetical protein